MIRFCAEMFLGLSLALSAAAGTLPQSGHDEAVYYADAYAAHYQIPRELIHAIITQESGWNPGAISPKGAMGLMQLMPATAAEYGVQNPFGISENLSGGVRYLADLMQQFHGDFRLVLAAYYRGSRPNPSLRSPLLGRRCACLRCFRSAPLPCGARPPQHTPNPAYGGNQ